MLEKLIVFVEELSMEAALEIILPKVLGEIEFQIIRFQCKDDLLKNAPTRLKGYAAWLPKDWRILILLDRDDDDCKKLKAKLEKMAIDAGLRTKSTSKKNSPFQVVNRIAIEELESWFFGDWDAVQKSYPRVPTTIPQKAGFRDPDAIAGGTWEAMERVLNKAGYFGTGLRKVELARTVAAEMVIERNKSSSFQAFVSAVEAAMV